MSDDDYMMARQRGYDILCRYFGLPNMPDAPNNPMAYDIHRRVVKALNRLERKMGIHRTRGI